MTTINMSGYIPSVIALGLITFIRFLREHPVPDLSEGEGDDERE